MPECKALSGTATLRCTVLALALLCVGGCATVKGATQSTGGGPPSLSLYRNLLVSVSTSVPDSDDDALRLRKKTLEKFKAKNVFPKVAWVAPDKSLPTWDLRLNLNITFKDEVNMFLRWLIGRMAGTDDLTIEGYWVENKTGQKLDHFVCHASSPGGFWLPSWIKNGITYDVDECAKEIVQYALDHKPQLERATASQGPMK